MQEKFSEKYVFSRKKGFCYNKNDVFSLILLLIATLSLISCSCKLHDSLDGEYYWISSERNELAFTIKGDKGTIEHGEADYFTINKENAH